MATGSHDEKLIADLQATRIGTVLEAALPAARRLRELGLIVGRLQLREELLTRKLAAAEAGIGQHPRTRDGEHWHIGMNLLAPAGGKYRWAFFETMRFPRMGEAKAWGGVCDANGARWSAAVQDCYALPENVPAGMLEDDGDG
jgi:hypothetical protein